MQLKLAEYNKDGKFEGFLGLGTKDGFAYCGDYIFATYLDVEHPFEWDDKHRVIYASYYLNKFYKDEKDPLNRFDGRFSNRSYGNGRFILIVDDEDDIFVDLWAEELNYEDGKKYKTHIIRSERLKYSGRDRFELTADLHQNPELYEKLKGE